MDILQYVIFAAELLAAIAATVYYYKYKHTHLKWLLPLLWYIFINEPIALSYYKITNKSNAIFYNIYDFIVCITLLWLIYTQVKNLKKKNYIRILQYVSVIVFIINFISINPLKGSTAIAFTISSILIVVSLLITFIDLLSTYEIIDVKRDLFLWVCFGFLIFHISYPVIYFVRDYLYVRDHQVDVYSALHQSFYTIQVITTALCYSLIAFAFMWSNKRTS